MIQAQIGLFVRYMYHKGCFYFEVLLTSLYLKLYFF